MTDDMSHALSLLVRLIGGPQAAASLLGMPRTTLHTLQVRGRPEARVADAVAQLRRQLLDASDAHHACPLCGHPLQSERES